MTHRSRDYFRSLTSEELLLHGKEALTYTDEYVVALVERFEDVLEDLHETNAEFARQLFY